MARGLARLLKPGAPAMLVLFGTFCPGEMVTEVLRGRPHLALRRCKRGEAPARLAKREFHVVYHRRAAMLRAFAPWFVLEKRLGIGVTVPPSAADLGFRSWPHLLAAMETLDRVLARPLAMLGDHVLYQFRRTTIAVGITQPQFRVISCRLPRQYACGAAVLSYHNIVRPSEASIHRSFDN